jgi:hypothetical protein
MALRRAMRAEPALPTMQASAPHAAPCSLMSGPSHPFGGLTDVGIAKAASWAAFFYPYALDSLIAYGMSAINRAS